MAKALAEKGCKVLLVEKFKMPRYKSCSGVLIKKSMELVMKYFGEAVPETAMCTPTDMIHDILETSKAGMSAENEEAVETDLSEMLSSMCEPYMLIAKTNRQGTLTRIRREKSWAY